MTWAQMSLDDVGGVATARIMSTADVATMSLRVRNGVCRSRSSTTAKATTASASKGSYTGAWATAPRGTAAAVAATSTTNATRPATWFRVPTITRTGNVSAE